MSRCLCEHASHVDHRPNMPTTVGPTAHPVHTFGHACNDVTDVQTIFGTFPMCAGCARALPPQYRQ